MDNPGLISVESMDLSQDLLESFRSIVPSSESPGSETPSGHLEKYRFFWEWQRDLKGSSLLKAAKWQLIEVP